MNEPGACGMRSVGLCTITRTSFSQPPPRYDISSAKCESYKSSEDPTDGGFVRLFGRAKKEKWGEKTRVTYFVETDKQLRDLTVIGYVDDSPRAAVEASRVHVLSLMKGLLKRESEEFTRWWVEDKDGNILESHDELKAPTRPTM